MTHKLLSTGLNLLAGIALVSGISLSTVHGSTYASVSGVGSSVLEKVQSSEQTLDAPSTISYTNAYQAMDAGIQLILGMLFILLGFFMHGLARSQDERPVHITVAPPKQKLRHKTWIWVNMQI